MYLLPHANSALIDQRMLHIAAGHVVVHGFCKILMHLVGSCVHQGVVNLPYAFCASKLKSWKETVLLFVWDGLRGQQYLMRGSLRTSLPWSSNFHNAVHFCLFRCPMSAYLASSAAAAQYMSVVHMRFALILFLHIGWINKKK